MGRSGDLIRQTKGETRTITFTRAQLEEHDRQVVEARFKAAKALAKKEAAEYDKQREKDMKEHVDKVWEENAATLLSYFLSVSCRVLVEHFGWKPPGPRGRNVRVMRYGTELAKEVNRITRTSREALRLYAIETNRLYGIEFNAEEKDD